MDLVEMQSQPHSAQVGWPSDYQVSMLSGTEAHIKNNTTFW
jgi:hypothetical protein